jgi:hypothetical protein
MTWAILTRVAATSRSCRLRDRRSSRETQQGRAAPPRIDDDRQHLKHLKKKIGHDTRVKSVFIIPGHDTPLITN